MYTHTHTYTYIYIFIANKYNQKATAAFVLALCLMIVGIKNGEVSVVLTKATSICLQCIGDN